MDTIKNLREVLMRLKHKKLGKPAIKLCPKCGSPKIKLSSGVDAYPRMYGITPSQYVCEECGYRGPIAMELEEEPS
jgi:C4-type Zn-finger protein